MQETALSLEKSKNIQGHKKNKKKKTTNKKGVRTLTIENNSNPEECPTPIQAH